MAHFPRLSPSTTILYKKANHQELTGQEVKKLTEELSQMVNATASALSEKCGLTHRSQWSSVMGTGYETEKNIWKFKIGLFRQGSKCYDFMMAFDPAENVKLTIKLNEQFVTGSTRYGMNALKKSTVFKRYFYQVETKDLRNGIFHTTITNRQVSSRHFAEYILHITSQLHNLLKEGITHEMLTAA